jgi:GxxExxY protein
LRLLAGSTDLTAKIIKAAIEVHRNPGSGTARSRIRCCLIYELREAGLKVECQLKVPVVYKGVVMDCFYRLDLLVNDLVIVEVKAVDAVLGVHRAQLLTQMKFANKPAGLILNFNVPLMKDHEAAEQRRFGSEGSKSLSISFPRSSVCDVVPLSPSPLPPFTPPSPLA